MKQEKDSLVGEILVHSWGYSMTLVDFYQVIRESESSVWIKEVCSEKDPTGYMSGETVACKDHFIKDQEISVLRKRGEGEGQYFTGTIKTRSGEYINRHSGCFLKKWDGKPKYYNHCD